MTHWLDPCRHALDGATRPVTVFFRDDDAGWKNERLFALLELFLDKSFPLAIAVIPRALTDAAARRLGDTVDLAPAPVDIHQHGFAHLNHEPEGRASEFGPSRPMDAQRHDIEHGRVLLGDMFGFRVRPIFTPPWNRCTRATARCLVDLGFRVLSRDCGAEPVGLPGLTELPVHWDWFAKRHRDGPGAARRGETLAAALSADRPTGIMLHHAAMDSTERNQLEELLNLFVHSNVRVRPMWALAREVMSVNESDDFRQVS